MPKKVSQTMSLTDCKRLAQGASTWAEVQSALKGSGCSQAMKGQIWAEMKGGGKDVSKGRGRKVVAKTVTKRQSVQKQSAAKSAEKEQVMAVIQENARKPINQDKNTYKIALRLVPTGEDKTASPAETAQLIRQPFYAARAKEIITNSLYGFTVKNIELNGNEAIVTVQSNADSKIYDDKTTVEVLRDNYGDLAADTWMGGEISLNDVYELFLSLVYIDAVGKTSGTAATTKKATGTAGAAATERKRVSAKKVSATPRKAIGKASRGCVEQTTKKYTSRASPAYPANECCGEVMFGQGKHAGLQYISNPDSNGVCRWVVLK